MAPCVGARSVNPVPTENETMKTRLVLAALLAVSFGVVANAQTAPPPSSPPPTNTPPTSMPSSTMNRGEMSNSTMNKGEMSNDAIVNKVKKELMSHGLSSDDIAVTFADGTATLSGSVTKHADVKKAKSAAMKVRGVKKVDTSGLDVKSSSN